MPVVDIKVPPWMPRSTRIYDGPDAFPRCKPWVMDCTLVMGEKVILIHFPEPIFADRIL